MKNKWILWIWLALAAGCGQPTVRRVERTQSPQKLAEYALEAEDPAVRMAAVAKVADDSVIERVALGDPSDAVRLAALKKMDASRIRSNVLDHLDDQELLASMVEEIADVDLARSIVAWKLTNSALLVRIVKDGHWKLRSSAAKKVTDPTLLAELATESPDREIRSIAVRRLEDQALLARIAVEDEDHGVRAAAVYNLDDRELLARIAVADMAAWVREIAVKRLDNQELLAHVAIHDPTWAVREEAFKRVTDTSALAMIAREAPEARHRTYALEKVDDPSTLARVAIGDPISEIRTVAARKLKDPRFLIEVAAHASDLRILGTAFSKLTTLPDGVPPEDSPDAEPSEATRVVMQFANALAPIECPNVRGGVAYRIGELLAVYCDPLWLDRFGPLVSFKLDHRSISQAYTGPTITGEVVSVKAAFARGPGTGEFQARWSTSFPKTAPRGQNFEGARMNFEDAFAAWLPQLDVAEVAVRARSWRMRSAAAVLLDDRELLAQLAENDPAIEVRISAKERLEQLRKTGAAAEP